MHDLLQFRKSIQEVLKDELKTPKITALRDLLKPKILVFDGFGELCAKERLQLAGAQRIVTSSKDEHFAICVGGTV